MVPRLCSCSALCSYLSNLSSLWEQMHHEPLQSADTGAATCSLILALHRNLASSSEQKTELPTLLLSELQVGSRKHPACC